MEMLEKLSLAGIVPVLVIEDADEAVNVGAALRRGGINAAEITFRTEAAEEALASIAAAFPDMAVGAGTVLTCEQVDRAVKAGAGFIVSPGLNPRVVRHCQEIGVPVIPGVHTAGEIEQAMELGLDKLKFFPAEQSGGVPMLKALSAPYRGIRFMPTGGISPENMREYLALPCVMACGGSWMVSKAALQKRDYAAVEAASRTAMLTMLDFRLESVSVGTEAGDAVLADVLGQQGENGVVLSTPFPARAEAYFALRGLSCLDSGVRLIGR